MGQQLRGTRDASFAIERVRGATRPPAFLFRRRRVTQRDTPAVARAAYGVPTAASMSRAGSSIGIGRGLVSDRPETTSILMKPSLS